MKIVFMGTPDFAVPVLKEIISAGNEVGYVITQPDKAKNRGKKIQPTPVKEVALENHIEVLQPEKIRQSSEVIETIRTYAPDIIVVVAYGQIIHRELLEIPKYGCINVHGSLLPKLRGASPIQHAILDGEKTTGVTIMQMSEGLDTGDMLTKVSTDVGDKNSQQLNDELSILGAKLLVSTLPMIESGTLVPEKQDDDKSTYAKLIFKEDGRIKFDRTAAEIERQIRAFDPWPGAFCKKDEDSIKVWRGSVIEGMEKAKPGTVMDVSDKGILVNCGKDFLLITEIQMPGKKRIAVKDYLKGNTIEKGILLR